MDMERVYLEVKSTRLSDWMRVNVSSVKGNFQMSDLSNRAENGGWAVLSEVESQRGEAGLPEKNHSFGGFSISMELLISSF